MKTEIKNELTEIAASLAGIGNDNCYRVPDNYFEDFADEVMSKIQLPFTQLPLTAPPANYFEGLAGTILSKVKSNGIIIEEDSEVTKELAALSPLIAGIKKVNVYTVPADYFTTFKVEPPAAQKTKVVPLHQPVRWVRFAIAAAIIGIVAIGGLNFFKSNNSSTTAHIPFIKDYGAPLSAVSDDAIASYLKESPEEMDFTPSIYDDSKVNTSNLTEQLLQDVSDADIQEYLKENQQTGEKDVKGI